MSKYDFQVVEEKAFRLWDYGWVDFMRCRIPNLNSDSYDSADIFVSLLNHRIYRRGYCGSSHETTGAHGPLSIERLKPSDFVEISLDELNGYIHARYTDTTHFDAPPDKSQIEVVDDYFNKLPKEGTRYFRLAVNHEDEVYHIESWFIHIFFDEYILVNPKQEMMWLMVMGYD